MLLKISLNSQEDTCETNVLIYWNSLRRNIWKILKGAATSKSFCNTVKLFITHKGFQTNENTTIEVEKNEQIDVKGLDEKVDIRTTDLIKDEKILVEMFNKHYISIVEKRSGITPKNLTNPLDPKVNEKTIHEIFENYQNHPSIIKIKGAL